jgi:hypothetical protein
MTVNHLGITNSLTRLHIVLERFRIYGDVTHDCQGRPCTGHDYERCGEVIQGFWHHGLSIDIGEISSNAAMKNTK